MLCINSSSVSSFVSPPPSVLVACMDFRELAMKGAASNIRLLYWLYLLLTLLNLLRVIYLGVLE